MYDITGTTGTFAPVAGSIDGVRPVRGLFAGLMHIYEASEIFTGDIGEDKFVPKVGDMTIDHDTGVKRKVVSVNDNTYLSDLVKIDQGQTYNDVQRIYGFDSPELYRLYVNNNTAPNTAVINKRLTVGGSQASYAIVFRGTNNFNPINSISEVHDAGGTFITNRIPLELVEYELNKTKAAIWSAQSFKISQDLQDGEIVTVLYYSDAGHVIHKSNILVENTAYIGEVYGSLKFIESIDLITPFLNADDPTSLTKLINTPISAANMRLVVNYSDGSVSQEYPLSSPEFDIIGLEAVETATVPATMQILAKYEMKINEGAANTLGSGTFITRQYDIHLVKA